MFLLFAMPKEESTLITSNGTIQSCRIPRAIIIYCKFLSQEQWDVVLSPERRIMSCNRWEMIRKQLENGGNRVICTRE